ncbi:helix-turn-helix transcriptional regulator [Erwinia sp. S63]|uniref:helix-turn-helix domain-containing protein n=1 Tax=Erwinia sp. S63 TaxID=2769341 RepID=UPI001909558E|nr:AraC family transcriptional regulator [Erwinia sp. S63]MBK0097564.1 helix-turn-helix transcriptional regulator [Erwinia sp. S63]
MLSSNTVALHADKTYPQQKMSRSSIRASIELHHSTVRVTVRVPSVQPGGRVIRYIGGASAMIGEREKTMVAVIQQMVEWIDNHLDENLSVNRISTKSGYSIWHFQRKFMQLTGLNVYEYVRVRRIINTAYILTRSRKRILEIAVENGFNCQASFTRTMRDLTGFTPGQMRAHFTGNEEGLEKILRTLMSPD